MLKKAEILTFGIDSSNNMPLIVLKEINGSRTVAIPTGTAEANAIALKTLGLSSDRPLTIDLTLSIINSMKGSIERIVLNDIENRVFFAKLHIKTNKGALILDCRPSDAIALALRAEAPMFIEDKVFDKSNNEQIFTEGEKIRNNIAETATLDFGRYYLK